jgi:Fe-S cluster assembly protein SufD
MVTTMHSRTTLTSTNGCWLQPLFSIPGVTLSSLAALTDPHAAALYASWHRHPLCGEDSSSPFACASLHDVLCIDVLPGTTVPTPLHILHLMDSTTNSSQAMPRLHISIGKNATLHIIETTAATGRLNCYLSIDIDEGGCLQHTRIDRSLSSPAICSSLRATLKKNAVLTSILATATPLSRHTASIILAEEGAEAHLQGLSLLPPHHHSSLSLFIDHQAPATLSSQQYKGIVAASSSGSFESTVRIHKEACKSTSRQHSHFLTLEATAQTKNKPNFELFTDDVTATHGATSGMMDQEALFYLSSRGLPPHEARQYLIEGFCEELLQKLPAAAAPSFSQSILATIRGLS